LQRAHVAAGEPEDEPCDAGGAAVSERVEPDLARADS
jgi:hypothetical protein